MGALDLLSSTGFVNYFGKWTNLEMVEIPPLILKKGKTYISLYGLSYINDKRLARMIRDGKVLYFLYFLIRLKTTLGFTAVLKLRL